MSRLLQLKVLVSEIYLVQYVHFIKFPVVTVKRRVDEKFSVLAAEFRDKLIKVENVSLTTDVWTETMQMRSYIGITVHFFNKTNIESGKIS